MGQNSNTWSTIWEENSGLPSDWATNKNDTYYTSIHGLKTTYTPVGVTFIESTDPIITANGTVSFPKNPVVANQRLAPCRWKILTSGTYRVYGATKIFDNTPVYSACMMLWRRTGASVQQSTLAGTTVEGIGLSQQVGTFGTNQYGGAALSTILSIDGIYELSAYDQVYFSVNADDSNGGYGDTIVTHMSIQEL